MDFTAVILARGKSERLSGLRPRPHFVDVILLLVVVLTILRYHRRRHIVALIYHFVLHAEGIREFGYRSQRQINTVIEEEEIAIHCKII